MNTCITCIAIKKQSTRSTSVLFKGDQYKRYISIKHFNSVVIITNINNLSLKGPLNSQLFYYIQNMMLFVKTKSFAQLFRDIYLNRLIGK